MFRLSIVSQRRCTSSRSFCESCSLAACSAIFCQSLWPDGGLVSFWSSDIGLLPSAPAISSKHIDGRFVFAPEENKTRYGQIGDVDAQEPQMILRIHFVDFPRGIGRAMGKCERSRCNQPGSDGRVKTQAGESQLRDDFPNYLLEN